MIRTGGWRVAENVKQRTIPRKFERRPWRSVSGNFRSLSAACRAGAWTDSDVQGGPVDQLLDVAVERPALDQREIEVGRTLEDRAQPGLTRDDREERHLDTVDQTGGHQRPVHRQTAVRAQRYLGLLLEPGYDLDGVTAHDACV